MRQTLSYCRRIVPAVLGCLFLAGPVAAQQQASNLPAPRLMTIMPMGAKSGSNVDVAFTGTDLEEPEQMLFNHAGIKAVPIVPDAPPPDPKKPMVAKPPVTKFKVTVDAGVPVGQYDVRLVNKWGVSNARAFVVGDLNEAVEVEPNNDIPQAQKIEMNTVVNGAMANPTDVDYYTIQAKKGQRIIISCLASSIDSRFHATIQVYDGRNRLVTENRNYKDHDALVDVSPSEDGPLNIRVFQFTHTAGSAEFFYRLSVSTAPWIDAVFPPTIEPGKTVAVTVHGRNLPGGAPDPTKIIDGAVMDKIVMNVTAPADPASLTFRGHINPMMSGLDGFELRVKNAAGTSNPYFLTFARAPVVLENPNNDTPETAQEIKVPCELAGTIEKRRDRDYYVFSAVKGDILNFDLFSDRLGVEGYVQFSIRSLDGKQTYAQQEESNPETLSSKFHARTDDPAPFRFVVPADGKYVLVIGSKTANVQYGPRNVYRMKIAPDAPDFRLIVLGSDSYRPGTATVLKGGAELLTVLAWRNDNFTGDIALSVEGLPAGVTCPPQVLGGNLRYTQLVMKCDASAKDWAGEIKVKGTATVGGKATVREARAAGITWPIQVGQNFPRVARVESGIFAAVRGQAPYALEASIDKPVVTQGTPAVLTVKINRLSPDVKQPIQIQQFQGGQGSGTPASLPQGLTITAGNLAATATEVKMNVNIPANVPPGTYNLVVRSQTQVPYNKDPKATAKPNTQVVLPSTPVTITIIPKSLAQFTLAGGGSANVKVGGQVEVGVRVQRQFNFDGEFRIVAELPPGTQGVTIAPVTIPAGQYDGKLIVQVAPGATPGARNNINIKATAMFDKTPVVHEAKLNVNVTK